MTSITSALRPTLGFGLLLSALPCLAGPHKTLDLRNKTEVDGGEREISICARPSPDASLNLPGHMFVGYSLRMPGRPRAYVALGHTTHAPPTDALLSYLRVFPPVAGSISDERYTATLERCLVMKVGKADFEAAYALATARAASFTPNPANWPPTSLSYRLGSQDCMHYAISVAELFKSKGLRIPQRGATEMPLAYVRRLIEAN